MENNIFSKRLKKLRKEQNLSQKELGKITGITNSTISSYENGQRSPGKNKLKKFAETFDVSVDYLIGLTDIKANASDLTEGHDRIEKAISNHPKLVEYFEELRKRDSLQKLFEQTKNLSDNEIEKIIRVIKAIDETE
ncbi:Helix-turn-helix [Halarsenatibacter silvermanii]|uniref:Helix-turn-helix n=1 Tax=Halarsenatibacter silvermanii TaxID=321763 RepID=A0A1G9NL79_9FIRM|nr:Helix-turn-helix [Halarsenatibacter silvermanii]